MPPPPSDAAPSDGTLSDSAVSDSAVSDGAVSDTAVSDSTVSHATPSDGAPFTISFVCLGNICRSPTAEGVARHLIAARGLDGIAVESAGTAAAHVGEPPDRRSASAAAGRGITLDGAARRFDPADLDRVDLVVAMDSANLRDLRRLGDRHPSPPPLRLLREWDPQARDGDRDVPDPYYGGPDGFEVVLDLVTRSVDALLDDIAAGRLQRTAR